MDKRDERIEELGDGLRVVQNPEFFCFGVDAVLLANSVVLPRDAVAAEFCAGNAVVSILVAAEFRPKKLYAIEFQPELAELARRSVELSGLSGAIEIVEDDVLNALSHVGREWLDAVFVNPPYVRRGAGIPSDSIHRDLARKESTMGVPEIFEMADAVLKPAGELFMVHRPDRLVDIFEAARRHGIEPRELTMVQPSPAGAPNIVLVRFKKGAGRELRLKPPIWIYDESGKYIYNSEEHRARR